MTGPASLSIIIPAYNEAGNILATLENCRLALEPLSITHEILVIDDGSRDGTADIVRANARKYPTLQLLENGSNKGFGWSYRRGVSAAGLDHVVMVHGDNAHDAESLRAAFRHVGDADVISGYTTNMWSARPLGRTLFSKAFTFVVNRITRKHLKYYNGLQIHRASVLKAMRIESVGYGFQAETLVRALGVTKTLLEVPMPMIPREHGESQAFRVKNVIDVLRTLRLLVRLQHGAA
jgi:glycosyltransferase involved in cell wall biosynthesis